jgi:hypothetical protein
MTITIDSLLKSGFDIGLKDYPIFNEEYRPVLNNAIIEFYRFREIGFDMPAMFVNRLNLRMSIIMRNKYNLLYNAKESEYKLLSNIELKEEFTHSVTNTGSGTTEQSGTSTDTTTGNNKETMYNTEYPSDELVEGVENNPVYASGGTVTKTTNNNTVGNENDSSIVNHQEGTTTETYTRETSGASAGFHFTIAMQQFRDFIEKYDLDNMVIAELGDLFMTIYD